jgi:hypothetical protein
MAAELGGSVALRGLHSVLNGEAPDVLQTTAEQEALARRGRVVQNVLPPVIAMAARSGYPEVVMGIVSELTGIRPNEVQAGLEEMVAEGSVRQLTEKDGSGWNGKLIVCGDDSRAAAYAPFVDIDGQLVPRIDLAETVQAVAQAHQAAESFRAAYAQTIPDTPPLAVVVPQLHQA